MGVVCVGLVGVPRIGLAEADTDRAAARSTAELGIAAFNDRRYAEALDLLGRAESIIHAPTHLLHMARAADRLGQLVQARELYLKIIRESLAPKAPRAFFEAQRSAQQEVKAIEARLPYLTIKLDGPLAGGTKIRLDDHVLPDVLVGVPFPADPGSHVIRAVSASGESGDAAKVALKEGSREQVLIKLPQASGTSPSVPPPAQQRTRDSSATVLSTTSQSPTPNDVGGSSDAKHSSALALGALGVGAVGAAVGTVFLVRHGSKQSDADSAFDGCKQRYCTPGEIDHLTQLDHEAATAGTLAWVSYGVGAAALATGVYLLLTAPPTRSSANRAAPALLPYIGLAQAGATLRF